MRGPFALFHRRGTRPADDFAGRADEARRPLPAFGSRRLAALLAHAVVPLGLDIGVLGERVDALTREVRIMTTAQDQVMADIATLKSEVAAIATAYQGAAAAAIADAVTKAKTAWDADDQAGWTAAHVALGELQVALNAGKPITPPATAAVPDPIAAPAPQTALAAAPAGGATTLDGGANAGGAPLGDGTSGTGTTNAAGSAASVGLAGTDGPTQ